MRDKGTKSTSLANARSTYLENCKQSPLQDNSCGALCEWNDLSALSVCPPVLCLCSSLWEIAVKRQRTTESPSNRRRLTHSLSINGCAKMRTASARDTEAHFEAFEEECPGEALNFSVLKEVEL